jgi:CHAT domain-containing protein/Tfp pilus assembly protein PilF
MTALMLVDKHWRVFSALLICCCSITSTRAQSRQTSPATKRPIQTQTVNENRQLNTLELTPGRKIQKDFLNGKIHTYRASLSSGQYAKIRIDPHGMDIVVSLERSGGNVEVRMSPVNEPETIFLVGEVAADLLLKIGSPELATTGNRYDISVEERRSATKMDRQRYTAQRLLSEGVQLGGNGNAPAKSVAVGIQKLRQALALWRIVGEQENEARTLNEIGELLGALGEAGQALDCHNKALEIYRTLSDGRGESDSLNHIGESYLSLGDNANALRIYSQALQAKRSIGHKKGEGQSLYGIGAAYLKSGALHEAFEHFENALLLARTTGDKLVELSAICGIGNVYAQQSEWRKALEYHQQALSLSKIVGNRRIQARVLSILGNDYLSLGEFQTALEYKTQTLSLRRTLGDKRGVATTLNGLANIYSDLGDDKKALEYFEESLPLMEAVGDKYSLAYGLMGLGHLRLRNGNLEAAQALFERALTLNRAAGDRRGESLNLRNLGRVSYGLKNPKGAIHYLSEAVRMARAAGDRTGEMIILANLARAEWDLDHLSEALGNIEASINIAESSRQSIVSPGLRASYITTNRGLYECYIDILMQMHQRQPAGGFDALAFQASERARARNLLDNLTESLEEIRQDVDPKLLEEQRLIWSELSSTTANLTRIQNSDGTNKEDAANSDVETLLRRARDVDARIRSANPKYAALVQPEILSLKQVQEEVLDDETLLLEFSVGEERSYVWALSKSSLKSYELPPAKEIEAVAQKVYELFALKGDLLYPDAVERLSTILLKPVAAELSRKKRIVIVAEGALQYIPFAALLDPNHTKQKADQPALPLVERSQDATTLILNHEIVMSPSASVMAVLRRELKGRKPAPNTLAVFADPVFDESDERVRSNTSSQDGILPPEKQRSSKFVLRSHGRKPGIDFARRSFERLILSRTEAHEIISLSPEGSRVLEALDFDASRATATSKELASYQIVHFATHSLFNNQHPELSGIVLSLVDDAGRPQNGFLRLFDIYNMKIGADLVVLSACQTALGKDVVGEGLVGLTRGFMYAGAPRVVASLWKVSDRSTSELMTRFYRNMLKERMRPSEALRAAQISMLTEKQWRAPSDWAGFVIQGDWQ